MIIWIASYPKSGNTLLRSILSAYFFSNDGNFNFTHLNFISQFPSIHHFTNLDLNILNDDEIFKNFIEAQKLINKQNKDIKFLKTHSSLCKINGVNFTDLKNTLGAVYIVRDPRNVVTSFAHHYNVNMDEATRAMLSKTNWLSKTEKMCKTFLSSWSENYNSWKQLKDKCLFIKYEDLVKKKKTVILKIFRFIEKISSSKLEINMIKLNKSIKSTEFESMKSLEERYSFPESMIDNVTGDRKKFFNLGPKNNWKNHLDNKNKNLIEKNFEKEMKELGYY